ncbi:MAG: T9SS type A sorting domain-containing protein [Candidatus Marinimicrobia bacterium]|nr:T9SS type A sorting domain-containing protein [Candidatus Neomarinimicrobiota bacterium]
MMSLVKRLITLASLGLLGIMSSLTAQVNISGDITADVTWTSNTEYYLVGQTFVQPGVTLTIEAGTTIKAMPDDGNGLAPALVVLRGGQIIADGTADLPITFTSALPEEQLPQRGTWGGLIILGNAPISAEGGEDFIEGLFGIPFGGNDPDDSSGILRYVRVWYGGSAIGEGNEINGISFGGVGRGTIVDHCEVAWNLDDGFEFFGGTVDVSHLSVLFVGDDMFDTDEGYQGRGQFLFGMIGEQDGNRGFEMDNKTNGNMNSQPRSYPQFYNVTLVGSGSGASADNDQMIRLREGTGGDFRNLVIAEGKSLGIRITDEATLNLIPDSLYVSPNTVIWDCPDGQFGGDYGFTALEEDPLFRSMDGRETGGIIDPRPANTSSPLFNNIDVIEPDDFFVSADFKGAFGTDLWLSGYSWLDEMNRLGAGPIADGDANQDGSLDVLDVVAAIGHILGTNTISGDAYIAADVNSDGALDILDIVIMVDWILNYATRGELATDVQIQKNSTGLAMNTNGRVGAVQIELVHPTGFSLELQNAFLADYKTIGEHTMIIMVLPEAGQLFTTQDQFEVVNILAAGSSNYIPVNTDVPQTFTLNPAYPNPFNPSTSIGYSVPVSGNVNISVFDLQGRLVETLVNGSISAGQYDVTWNATRYASGAYLVRLISGQKTLTQKIMLVK